MRRLSNYYLCSLFFKRCCKENMVNKKNNKFTMFIEFTMYNQMIKDANFLYLTF